MWCLWVYDERNVLMFCEKNEKKKYFVFSYYPDRWNERWKIDGRCSANEVDSFGQKLATEIRCERRWHHWIVQWKSFGISNYNIRCIIFGSNDCPIECHLHKTYVFEHVAKMPRRSYFFFSIFLAGEFHHAINLSRPRIIFASNAVSKPTIAVIKQNKFVESIVVIDKIFTESGSGHGVNVTTLDELMSSVNINDCHTFECKSIDLANNVALVLCSSGTTGLPKGVELTQRNILVGTSQLKLVFHWTISSRRSFNRFQFHGNQF